MQVDPGQERKQEQQEQLEEHEHEPVGPEAAAKSPRKRNKPSLSCETCTVKKTKCDRARPICFACVKRRSDCHYSQIADLIEDRTSNGQKPRRKSKTEAVASNNKSSASDVWIDQRLSQCYFADSGQRDLIDVWSAPLKELLRDLRFV